MAVWETLAAVLDAFWTWCAEAGDRNIMLQGSAVFFGLWLIWQRGRFNWSKDAYDSSFNNVLLILMNGMLVPVGVVLMEWGHDARMAGCRFPVSTSRSGTVCPRGCRFRWCCWRSTSPITGYTG